MSTSTEAPEQVAPVVEGGLRPQLAPHAAVGALVVAAGAARIAVHAVGDDATVARWVAGAAFAIAVVAAVQVRRRVFDKRARRRALAFLAVAVGWLTSVTLVGLSLGAVGLLMAFGYGLSMHWWRQHPVGLIQPKVTRSQYQRLWAENNGASDGALPGSRLANAEPIAAGVRYALKLRAGKQTLEMAIAAMGRLRGGLHLLPDQQMLLEAHPSDPEPTLLLTIVTKSPIKEAVDWPGPSAFDSTTGRVRLGPYADGEGVATWRAYTDNRLWGGFIQGGSGSGKSRLIESIAFSLAASESHPTVIWYGDGQRGASSPLLMRHADLFAGTYDRIHAMLAGMEMLMLLRQQENVELELEGFTATDDRPGVLGVIDECHKVFDKEQNPRSARQCQRIAATVAREGGKVGVNLLLASQEPTLGAFGGSTAGSNDSEVLRSNLLSGNGVMLAGKDPNAKHIFGVEDNPKKFPAYGGYGMVTTPAPGERQAHFRGFYLNDKLRAYWPGRIRWRELSVPEGHVALGREYGTRERSYADRKAALAALRRVVEQPASEPERTPNVEHDSLDGFGGATFPSWSVMVAQAQQEARKRLGPSHEKVVEALRAGHTSPARIAEAIELSVRQVHNLLGDLAEAGRVRGGGRQYEAVEQAA